MIRRTFPLGSSLLFLACAPQARTPAPELDSLLGAAVESRQVPMVVAMVATGDTVLYQGAIGVPARRVSPTNF
ncbi:MAG: hypothetical protein ACT4PM_03880 [Gemmatimonadales bacterium]